MVVLSDKRSNRNGEFLTIGIHKGGYPVGCLLKTTLQVSRNYVFKNWARQKIFNMRNVDLFRIPFRTIPFY
uniref:Uncharacterized protein n=1 Tax=Strongyloides venezuelensis TaxID=75913 RepID=A0A0K0G5Q6_STRVS